MHWLFFQTANLHCASNICSFVRIHILLYTSSLASLCVFFTYIRNVRVLYPSWFTGGSLRIPSSLLFSSDCRPRQDSKFVVLSRVQVDHPLLVLRQDSEFVVLSCVQVDHPLLVLLFSSLHLFSSECRPRQDSELVVLSCVQVDHPLLALLCSSQIASWLSFPAYRWITRFLPFSSLPFISSPLNVDLHFPLAPPPVSDMASMHQIREGIFTGDPAYPFSAHIP